MSKTYLINARKNVQLCQVEIEAESQEDAVSEYLRMAERGELEVSDYQWGALTEGDLDIEAHYE